MEIFFHQELSWLFHKYKWVVRAVGDHIILQYPTFYSEMCIFLHHFIQLDFDWLW